MFVTPLAGSGNPTGLEHRVDSRYPDETYTRSICGQHFIRYAHVRATNEAYRESRLATQTVAGAKPDPRVTDVAVGDTRACGKCDEIYRRRIQAALPLLPADVLASLSDQIKDS